MDKKALAKPCYIYVDKQGKLCIVRCIACGQLNAKCLITSGWCGQCGYNPNENKE